MRLTTALSVIFFISSAFAANFLVQVGADNTFTFSPNEIHPAAGDTVTFQFLTRNHSATTTTFEDPCPPPEGGVPGGFDVGFVPSNPGGVAPEVTITINDTEPHWVSCRQAAGAHCRLGMTLSINPTETQTEAQFMANAIAS